MPTPPRPPRLLLTRPRGWFTYQEAAALCHCAAKTIGNTVSRWHIPRAHVYQGRWLRHRPERHRLTILPASSVLLLAQLIRGDWFARELAFDASELPASPDIPHRPQSPPPRSPSARASG